MTTLTVAQKLALLKLYSPEIRTRLEVLHFSPLSSENAAPPSTPLLELVTRETLSKLREKYSAAERSEFARDLWSYLENSSMNKVLYESVLNFLKQEKADGLHEMLCMISEHDRRSRFSFVLLHLDSFMKYLNPKSALEYLKTISQYSVLVEKIENSLKGVEDDSLKKSIILRTIPLMGKDALNDILKCLYETTDEAKQFVESICPNFLRFYKLCDKEREAPRGVMTYWPVGSVISDFLNVNKGASAQAGKTIDLNWEDFPSASNLNGRLLESLENKSFKENLIHLREYQKELCEPALKGNNCIVSAPTGSGKTVVAAHVVKEHLNRNSDQGKPAKVLFLIYNTMILEQQANSLRRYLEHRYEVSQTCGADNVPLRELIAAKDVIVCTPMLIVNLLRENNTSSGEGRERPPFTLDEFTMIVLDECHNTKKNSPYSDMMKYYHRTKFSQRLAPKRRLPQIVGLTASLGVGNTSKDVHQALSHIVTLCALLDSKVISVVRRNVEELQSYSPDTADSIRVASDTADASRIRFQELIFEMMRRLEKHMMQLLVSNGIPVADNQGKKKDRDSPVLDDPTDPNSSYRYKGLTAPPADRTGCEYLNWASCHLGRIIPETTFESSSLKPRITELFEVLLILYRGLELYQDFTSGKSLQFIEDELNAKRRSLSSNTVALWDEYRPRLASEASNNNEMIDQVVKLLVMQQAQTPDFRAIVFIRTRTGARILAELLNTRPELNPPRVRIGCESIAGINKQTGGEEEKRTKREQVERLDRFASGETRVLVSTSVAEEGLDVAKCNLVIKYNYATNEIAHVQRRGRGRAAGSSCVLVTNSLSLREQEEKNILRETLMKQALSLIKNRSFDLEGEVERKIVDLWESIQKADSLRSETIQKQRTSGVRYSLLCSKCDTLICYNHEIKTYKESQYCVCAPSFWDKTRAVEIAEVEQTSNPYGGVAKLLCNSSQCGNMLGRVVRMDNINMPVLAANSFVLTFTEHGQSQRKAFKKWKQVQTYFIPDEVRALDMTDMQQAARALRFRADDTHLIGKMAGSF